MTNNTPHDFNQGYQRTVDCLRRGTYLSPEQMWLDYIPDLPGWTDKELFMEGVFKAFRSVNGSK